VPIKNKKIKLNLTMLQKEKNLMNSMMKSMMIIRKNLTMIKKEKKKMKMKKMMRRNRMERKRKKN